MSGIVRWAKLTCEIDRQEKNEETIISTTDAITNLYQRSPKKHTFWSGFSFDLLLGPPPLSVDPCESSL